MPPKNMIPPNVNEITDSDVEDMNHAVVGHPSHCNAKVKWSGETGQATGDKGIGKGIVKGIGKGIGKGNKGIGKGNKDRGRSEQNGPRVMEVFAGTGQLSKAMGKQGCVTEMVDLLHGAECDMSTPAVVEHHVQSSDTLKYAHFAPPCDTYSVARWPKIRPVVDGNL